MLFVPQRKHTYGWSVAVADQDETKTCDMYLTSEDLTAADI
jgi:hypothetical protein